MRVLIVEDEPLIRLVTAEALQEEGFEVVEAQDACEATELLDGAACFDALLTDVQMPGLRDGLDVVEHARCRDPKMPVLVVSGSLARNSRRLEAVRQPSIFIHKPYTLGEIVTALRRLAAMRGEPDNIL